MWPRARPPLAGVPCAVCRLRGDAGDPESPPAGAALTARFSPAPAGAIRFDSASGELRYEVEAGSGGAQDRRDFTVTFSAGGPAGTPAGRVLKDDACR